MASSGSSGVQTVRPSYVRAKQTAARAALQRAANASSQRVDTRSSNAAAVTSPPVGSARLDERVAGEVARLAADATREVRCAQRQLGAGRRHRRAARSGPRARRNYRRVEQRAIVVDEPPLLFAAEPRREIAQIRAGAGAEIDDFERRRGGAARNVST